MADWTKNRPFDEKKTVKVTGVSRLLRDLIQKEFQRKKNTVEYCDDVNKLHVCPDGLDYVLVEFTKDIPAIGGSRSIGNTLNINGTPLAVERWKQKAGRSEAVGSQSVSIIWPGDDNDEKIFPPKNEERLNVKSTNEKDQGGKQRTNDARDARQNKINQRRGVDDQESSTETLFFGTEVKLSDRLIEKLKNDAKLQEILRTGKVKFDGKHLTGTWNAIHATGQRIVSHLSGLDNSDDLDSRNFSDKTSMLHGDPSGVSPRALYEPLGSSSPPSDQTMPGKQPDESFSVNTFFLRHIMAYNYEVFQKLEKVSKEISIEVKSKIERNLKLATRDDVDQAKFSKIVNKFIDFYQAQNQKMFQEEFAMQPKGKKEVISEARFKFLVVIDSSQEKDKITIYGEKEKVQEAIKFLKSKVGGLVIPFEKEEQSSKRTTRINSPDATGERGVVEKLSCVLFQNVTVAVYQGDITKEDADVIVNPANAELKHGGGAAGAIVKVGGRSIQDECDKFIKKRRYSPLNPGQVVVTKAGNLPCNLIIHAVGPRWYDYRSYQKDQAKKVLLNAVLNCLTIAGQNGAKSISIPAISSGIFGVPVEICAEVLFQAATDFAKNAPKSNSLTDIRFVNIDKPTSKVFAQEMKKRFGSSVKQGNVEMVHTDRAGTNANQYQQNLFNTGGQNFPGNLGTSQAGNSNPSGTHVEGRDSRFGADGKGSQDRKSNVSLKTLAFSSSGGHSSSTPVSYANAVTGDTTKEKDTKPGADPKDSDKEECSICLSDFTDKKTLPKCGHSFCAGCIDEAFKYQKKCPNCGEVYGALTGNQPPGQMFDSFQSTSLPGFKKCGTIGISYRFPNGTQGPDHPHPGKPYQGTNRNAYLPDNEEGRKVQRLLKKAFNQKLTFTIGQSTTTGRDDCVIWNDIHHKTNTTGGPTNYGYPDPDYLKRVQEELAAKGITE